jgi:hypothetical protein
MIVLIDTRSTGRLIGEAAIRDCSRQRCRHHRVGVAGSLAPAEV